VPLCRSSEEERTVAQHKHTLIECQGGDAPRPHRKRL
jgi:hypothetical protein